MRAQANKFGSAPRFCDPNAWRLILGFKRSYFKILFRTHSCSIYTFRVNNTHSLLLVASKRLPSPLSRQHALHGPPRGRYLIKTSAILFLRPEAMRSRLLGNAFVLDQSHLELREQMTTTRFACQLLSIASCLSLENIAMILPPYRFLAAAIVTC